MATQESFFTLSPGPGEITAKKARMLQDLTQTLDSTGAPSFTTVYDEVAAIAGPDGRLMDFQVAFDRLRMLMEKVVVELRVITTIMANTQNFVDDPSILRRDASRDLDSADALIR